MKKIVLLPLDERPCTYNYPMLLGKMARDVEIVNIKRDYLGKKKQAPDLKKIDEYLINSCVDADYLVIAIDTLLYGGILPSRLHYKKEEELEERLSLLKKLKEKNPKLKIFAYHLIMRCPSYSSNDEEPDYYILCGEQIHNLGKYEHLSEIRSLSEEEEKKYQEIQKFIKDNNYQNYVDDYLKRRNINTNLNNKSVDLVKENIIDFLIIPQDDSAPYGYTAKDQIKVRSHIQNLRLDLKVLMYPDADAVTNTLLARAINDLNKFKPKVFVRYASSTNGNLVPLYEDRNVSESIKYQIMAAGGLNVYDYSLADMILMVNIPGYDMQEAVNQKNNYLQYSVFRNLVEYVEFIDYLVKEKKTVIVADIAYANGGDLLLLSMLKEKNLLYKVNAYAGWNTSANTLGTCIPHGMINHIYKDSQAHLDFLALRYLEDLGYMSVVRNKIFQEISKEGMNWFTIDGKRGKVSKRIWKALNEFAQENLNTLEYEVEIIDNFQPWERMFETELVVKLHKKDLVKN